MKKKSSTPAEPVVQTPPVRLPLTPSQIKRMAGEIEASRKLIAGECTAVMALLPTILKIRKLRFICKLQTTILTCFGR